MKHALTSFLVLIFGIAVLGQATILVLGALIVSQVIGD
jgi:hypothetical protein